MQTSILYTAGLGNSAIYMQLKKGSNFFDFVNRSWTSASANTKVYLTEYAGGASEGSWYYIPATTTLPGETATIEFIYGSSVIYQDILTGYESATGGLPSDPAYTDGVRYCKPATVLTKALSKHPDNSATFRALALGWFNEVVRDVLNQPREWAFLSAPQTIAVVNNTVTLPTLAGEIIYVKSGDQYLSLISDIEADTIASVETVYGYTMANNHVLTLYGVDDAVSVVVKYNPNIAEDYTDTTDNTVFPIEFENLLVTGVRVHLYDYDKDGRYGKEEAKYAIAMSQMKMLDNRKKPADRTDAHGYTRVRWNGNNRA